MLRAEGTGWRSRDGLPATWSRMQGLHPLSPAGEAEQEAEVQLSGSVLLAEC